MKKIPQLLFSCAILFAASHALAASAFYTTLGINGAGGHRYPGVMVAIGDADLCDKLHDEIASEAAYQHAWLKSADAFVVVRNERTFPQGKAQAVYPSDLTNSKTPIATAYVYDVRSGLDGKSDVTHVAQSGTVVLGEADVIAQAPLPVRLQLDFPPGGPAVEKEVVATYCPAFAALTQLWSH